MSNNSNHLVLGVREHLLSGHPITLLESIALFGVPGLTGEICRLRKEGYVIKTKRIPFVAALRRINESATLVPPQNLPIRAVALTEYRLSR